MGAPYGGAQFLADTSAWTHVHRLGSADLAAWGGALRNRQIAICDAVILELGRGARRLAELDALELRFTSLRRLQITDGDWHAAKYAIREVATIKPEYHRPISPADALIAVTAERYGMGVIHNDGHFNRLNEVVSFENRPIAAAGLL